MTYEEYLKKMRGERYGTPITGGITGRSLLPGQWEAMGPTGVVTEREGMAGLDRALRPPPPPRAFFPSHVSRYAARPSSGYDVGDHDDRARPAYRHDSCAFPVRYHARQVGRF